MQGTGRAVVVAVVAVVALAGGGMVGAVSADTRPDDTTTAVREVEVTPIDLPRQPTDTPTCSIYDIPSLESGIVARANLVHGSPYVLVCEDGSGQEALNQVFVFDDQSR